MTPINMETQSHHIWGVHMYPICTETSPIEYTMVHYFLNLNFDIKRQTTNTLQQKELYEEVPLFCN